LHNFIVHHSQKPAPLDFINPLKFEFTLQVLSFWPNLPLV